MKQINKKLKRTKRTRSRIFGTKDKPRMTVFRSNKFISAQMVDDNKGVTLVYASDKLIKIEKAKAKKISKIESARLIGMELAKKAKAKKIARVVFDRGGYKYHGRIKALAEGAREGGLKF